jgi:uncharacterized protein YggE
MNTLMVRTAAFGLAVASLGLAAGAMAQPAPMSHGPMAEGMHHMGTMLTVTAEGRSTRVPDVAEVSGGVVTTAPTAAAAMRENADKMNAVVDAVRKAGVADRDIQTTGLSLSPQYRYVNNAPPVLTGYQATNTVSLRIRRIADTGKLLDALVAVGANQINGPNFTVENSAAALDEARVAAVKTGRARAELYAGAAGLKVKRIVSITEGGTFDPGPRPMMMAKAMREDMAAAPPVAPGEVALNVNVTMTFELE